MNLSKVKLLKEHETHYVCHDGTAEFRVPKQGLSEAMHGRIRGMADGGTIDQLPPRQGPDVGTPEYGMPQQVPIQSQPDAGVLDLQSAPVPNEQLRKEEDFAANVARLEGETKRRDQLVTEGNHVQPAAAPLKSLSLAEAHPQERKEAPPAATPAPARGGALAAPAVVPGAAEEDAANRQKELAAQAQYSAEAQLAREEAAAIGAHQTQLEHDALEARQRADRADAEGRAAVSKVQAASDDAKSIDTTVDPGRYWASRSTGQKITGIIGLVLGALGAGPNGVNRASELMNQAIDRDVEAQKSEHTLRMQKGEAAVKAATSMYGMHRDLLKDDAAARDAASATARELAINKVDLAIASVAEPQAKARLEALLADLLAGKAKNTQDVYFKVRDASTKQQIANADMIRAQADAAKAGAVKPGKNNELAQGALQASKDLEAEFTKNPSSPRIGQLRASLKLHLNKLQGGRFNEEINKMTESLIPGNEGSSAWQRTQGAFDPAAVREKFAILEKHIAATANTLPPAAGPE